VSETILFVDDDANVLAAYQRQLRKQFSVQTALGSEAGLAAVSGHGPFAVVFADMQMPGMDGVEFLRRVRALAPDSVRMMLTGNTDQRTAMAAVNEGAVFRFLTKPCPPEVLAGAIRAGLAQYRLIVAEKELLEQTLGGSVQVMADVLALTNPLAFGRAARARGLVQQMARALGLADTWQLEVAAMLSQVGCVAVPETVLAKVYRGGDVTPRELAMFEAHPDIGRDLIRKIPRLEAVAEIIAYQEKRFDGQGPPPDGRLGADLPLGARLLKVALDFDNLKERGHSGSAALEHLRYRAGWYDPGVVDALDRVLRAVTPRVRLTLPVGELCCQMQLDEDVHLINGVFLVGKGHEITEPLLQRLRNFAVNGAIREPVRVLAVAPDGGSG